MNADFVGGGFEGFGGGVGEGGAVVEDFVEGFFADEGAEGELGVRVERVE